MSEFQHFFCGYFFCCLWIIIVLILLHYQKIRNYYRLKSKGTGKKLMNNINEIWKETLAVLKEEVAEAPFSSFIEPLEPVSLNMKEKTLTLKAQNDYHIERLNARHKSVIEDILREISGQDITCKFIISTQETDTASKDKISKLIPKYTFDNFVIGKSNYYAHAASNVVAKSPGKVYNPLVIYGGAGLGKTHLVVAIGNQIISDDPTMDVVYVSSETFTNEMINSIKNGKMESFRDKYRKIDTLIIDDIQFFSNKEAVQEEFFHTFEELYRQNKQIVITSDTKPDELQNFDERLKSRFVWSLIADITSPDVETRNAILLKKAEEMGLEINDDLKEAINYIAEKVQFNVRELEGALTRVLALSKVDNQPITLSYAKRCLKNIYVSKENDVTIDYIKNVVCEHFGISENELTSSSRTRNLAYPRQIAMYLSRQFTKNSLPKIGEEFNRDHTTVMHAYSKIEADMKVNESLKSIVVEIIEKIKN